MKDESIKLQLEMGINYHQGVGELLHAMVTCRPDISFPVIKLSQYSINPACEYYKALRKYTITLTKPETKESLTGEQNQIKYYQMNQFLFSIKRKENKHKETQMIYQQCSQHQLTLIGQVIQNIDDQLPDMH